MGIMVFSKFWVNAGFMSSTVVLRLWGLGFRVCNAGFMSSGHQVRQVVRLALLACGEARVRALRGLGLLGVWGLSFAGLRLFGFRV